MEKILKHNCINCAKSTWRETSYGRALCCNYGKKCYTECRHPDMARSCRGWEENDVNAALFMPDKSIEATINTIRYYRNNPNEDERHTALIAEGIVKGEIKGEPRPPKQSDEL